MARWQGACGPRKLPPARARVNAQRGSARARSRSPGGLRRRGASARRKKATASALLREGGRESSAKSWAPVCGRASRARRLWRRGIQGPTDCSPYQPCACPYDSFARDRGISPQTAKHEEDRERLPGSPSPSAHGRTARARSLLIAIAMPGQSPSGCRCECVERRPESGSGRLFRGSGVASGTWSRRRGGEKGPARKPQRGK